MHHRHSEGLGVRRPSVLHHVLSSTGVVGRGSGVDSEHRPDVVDEGRELNAVENLVVWERGREKLLEFVKRDTPAFSNSVLVLISKDNPDVIENSSKTCDPIL